MRHREKKELLNGQVCRGVANAWPMVDARVWVDAAMWIHSPLRLVTAFQRGPDLSQCSRLNLCNRDDSKRIVDRGLHDRQVVLVSQQKFPQPGKFRQIAAGSCSWMQVFQPID